MSDFNFSRRRMRQFDAPQKMVDIWCEKHWSPIRESRHTENPINGLAATEFLFRAFIVRCRSDPTYRGDISDGMAQALAVNKAFVANAPICCLFPDDTMRELRERCRHTRLAITHPEMNDQDDGSGLIIPQREELILPDFFLPN